MERFSPRKGEDYYVTRLRSGDWVRVSVGKIVVELQKTINEIEDSVDLIVVMCTGSLKVKSRKPLILLDELLTNLVSSLKPHKLGVIAPEERQYRLVIEKWSKVVDRVKLVFFNPYSEKPEELMGKVNVLRDTDLIVVDCIGYRIAHAEIVRSSLDKPVLLPRTILFSIIADLMGLPLSI